MEIRLCIKIEARKKFALRKFDTSNQQSLRRLGCKVDHIV